MGKGKDTSTISTALEHHSTPLSALRDPSEFGPPPKRVPGVTGSSPTTPSGGVGSALVAPELPSRQERSQIAQISQEKPDEETALSGPYKTDTTGLSTAHLPPPPKFRGNTAEEAEQQPKVKPQLPPRLPPRDWSSVVPATSPPPYEPIQQASGLSFNQGAIDRLGKAGISVPGLGIGRQTSPILPPRAGNVSAAQPESSASPPRSRLSELQGRFANMRTASSDSASSGTTWAQKRAALETASNFKKDPSLVSASDLKDAVLTANNFRQRHGEQVATGWKVASNANQKYGLVDRVISTLSRDNQYAEPPKLPSPMTTTEATAHKKPPPPRPPKKQELSGNATAPPPIPTSSKPKPT